jgi:Ca2+/Na+ antiporter
MLLAGGGVILFFAAFHQFFQRTLGKVLGGIGTFFGVITGICFAGVGLTPWDVNGPLHGNFVLTAFSAFPLAAIFYAATVLHDRQYPRRFAAVWIAFAVLLVLYIGLLFMGPSGEAPEITAIYTIGQKIIVYASIVSIFLEAVGALQVGRGRFAVKTE